MTTARRKPSASPPPWRSSGCSCATLLYKGEAAYERAYERAREALGADEDGRRSELLALIRTADDLTNDLLALIETTDGLTPGQARSVRLQSGEAVRFNLRDLPDGTYAIDAATASEGINPALYLYRHAGNRLVEIASDDDGGDKHLDSRIVATLDSTETYLVGVQEFSGRPGSVTLTITPAGSTQ